MKKKKKNKIIKSITVGEADLPNENNRVYSRSVLEKVIDDFNKNKSDVLGQLGTAQGTTAIRLENASHIVKNLRMDGNKLVCDIQILDTPEGEKLSSLIKGKSFRLRGTGYLEDKTVYTVHDYKLISIDALDSEKAS